MSRRVVVLGHRGMLGHVVARYLAEKGAEVLTVERRFESGQELEWLADLRALRAEAAVNAIALRATPEQSTAELFRVNALLPQLVESGVELLVQPSTDGVFSGVSGPTPESAPPDATDAYGLSKRLGELSVANGRTVVLRTSLVGPELGEPRSLLGWLSRQKGSVRGFTDQLWNGVTTLTWAELAWRAIQGELPPGIHHVASEPAVAKCELLEALRDAFGFELEVRPEASGNPVDRRLLADYRFGPIREQLRALRDWYGNAG